MLKGKTAVITGCLQGIGKKTMEVFAANGSDIFACAYQRTEEFEEYIKGLETKYQVMIKPIYFDLGDTEQIKRAVLEIRNEKRPIHILVNLAGITRDAMFQMVTMDQLKETFQVNFFSQIIFTQYIVKFMLQNKEGSIIFTSSITGMDGNVGQLAYGASKAALIAAMKTMSKELGPKGIRVNAIAPGVIKTPMTEVLPQQVIDQKLMKTDLGRIGSDEEAANLIMYLASDKSSYITGQTIRVDGGIG
jgi:3-oxoacyl-[acyl-carrier protein] reductase